MNERNGRRQRALVVFLSCAACWFPMTACIPVAVPEAVAIAALRSEPTPRPVAAAAAAPFCWTGPEATALLASVPVDPRPLRGDPNFDPTALAPAARHWYDALWDAITRTDTNDAIVALALSLKLNR
ncbi:MAG: hypothetical protein P1P87_16770 [Trueperaceae bacterium]|nr:hypothetical protein [Trueperaceae bacterium]